MLHAVFECPDLDATAALATALARVVRGGDILALQGDLGSGKTTFTRLFAANLGADPKLVSSPTFVVVNHYPAIIPSPQGPQPGEIIHADAYRLTSAEDLEPLGWDRYTTPSPTGLEAKPDAILLIEWPDRVREALPPPQLLPSLTITPTSELGRRVALALPMAWQSRPGVAELLTHALRRCPITARWVPPNQPTWPFFDERAQMADLGRWFSGSYSISRDITSDDADNPSA